jgi:hypothetical protein
MLGRDLENVAIVYIVSISQTTNPPSARVRLVQRLKGAAFWEPNGGIEVLPPDDTVRLSVGSDIILLFEREHGMPLQSESRPNGLCRIVSSTVENFPAVRRGIEEDYSDRIPTQ